MVETFQPQQNEEKKKEKSLFERVPRFSQIERELRLRGFSAKPLQEISQTPVNPIPPELLVAISKMRRDELTSARAGSAPQKVLVVQDTKANPVSVVRYRIPAEKVAVFEFTNSVQAPAESETIALRKIEEEEGAEILITKIPLEEVKNLEYYSFVSVADKPIIIEEDGREKVIAVHSKKEVAGTSRIRDALEKEKVSLPPQITVAKTDVAKFAIVHWIEKGVQLHYRERTAEEVSKILGLERPERTEERMPIESEAKIVDEKGIEMGLEDIKERGTEERVQIIEFRREDKILAELFVFHDTMYGRISGNEEGLELLLEKYAKELRNDQRMLILQVDEARTPQIEAVSHHLEEFKVVVEEEKPAEAAREYYLILEFSKTPIKKMLKRFFEEKKKQKLSAIKVIQLISFLEFLSELSKESKRRRAKGDYWKGASETNEEKGKK